MYLTTKTGRKFRLNTPEEEAQIEAGIAQDPDSRPLTEAEWEAVKPTVRIGRPRSLSPVKQSTTLRLPAETLARWRASGKGWQTRAAEVLAKHAPG